MTITDRTIDLDASGHLLLRHMHGTMQAQGVVRTTLLFVPAKNELLLVRDREGKRSETLSFELSLEEADKLVEALGMWCARVREGVSPPDPTP